MRKGPITVKRPTIVDETSVEYQLSRALMGTLLQNREQLCAAVLAGPSAWRNECGRLFAGTRLGDREFDSMFIALMRHAGPNPAYEYERALEAREQRENQTKAELAYLQELSALAHGKNREEEEAKILKAQAAPELARLPEMRTV